MPWELNQSICSLEQAAEYWQTYSLAMHQSPPAKLSLTHEKSSSSDNATESCLHSRSGMTSTPCDRIIQNAPLHSKRGEAFEEALSSLVDSRAKTSASQEMGQASMDFEADFGNRWPAWFAKLDRATSSWKIPQLSLFEDSERSLETWPRWGMMLDGVCWEQTPLEPDTEENEFGLWPTPKASIRGDCPSERRRHTPDLPSAVAMWPTPMANDSTGSQYCYGKNKKNLMKLPGAVIMFPTPQASDNRDRGHIGMPAIQRRQMNKKQIGLGQSVSDTSGALNPNWVEWLMDWPIGWTDLSPLAMGKYQAWRRSHGEL